MCFGRQWHPENATSPHANQAFDASSLCGNLEWTGSLLSSGWLPSPPCNPKMQGVLQGVCGLALGGGTRGASGVVRRLVFSSDLRTLDCHVKRYGATDDD